MSTEEYHKKTILQVVPALVSGGVERGTLEIAKKVVESGYKSIVISAGGPLVKILQASGSKHIKLNVASKNPITIWLNFQKIVKIIEEEKIDYALENYSSIVLMKVYKNFKEIIGKLEKNGLIEHSILVSNSSQEREEVYTNLRDLNLEEKISYFSTILVNKEVKKEVKVG